MSKFRLHQTPLRMSSGIFLVNSGMAKLKANEQTAKFLHQMAAGTYPFLESMDPSKFTRLLAMGEVSLGSALLLPMISSRIAGFGLMSFAGGLLGLYLKTPGMRQEGSLKPTQEGTAIAKDIWLFAMGMTLLVD